MQYVSQDGRITLNLAGKRARMRNDVSDEDLGTLDMRGHIAAVAVANSGTYIAFLSGDAFAWLYIMKRVGDQWQCDAGPVRLLGSGVVLQWEETCDAYPPDKLVILREGVVLCSYIQGRKGWKRV